MTNWPIKLQKAYRGSNFASVYRLYLKSKSWENKKEEFFSNPDNNYCQACWTFKRLQIHHKTYERVGNENLDDLITLCSRCHRDCHKYMSIQLTDEFVKKRQNGNI